MVAHDATEAESALVQIVVVALDRLLGYAGPAALGALEASAPGLRRQCRDQDVRLELQFLGPLDAAGLDAVVASAPRRRVASVASSEPTERGCAAMLAAAGAHLETFVQRAELIKTSVWSLELFSGAASLTALDCSSTRCAGQQKRAKFPTTKAHISAVFHSFWLILGRAIISRNGLEAWMLFSERARAEYSR